MLKFRIAILVGSVALAAASCAELEPPSGQSSLPIALGEATPLRVKTDLARGYRWELGWNSVSVYDTASAKLIRLLPLTGAVHSAARACVPDMVLSRNGAAVISSNAQTFVWRISPGRFEVEQFEITVDSDSALDFGFSGLAWGPHEETLYAVSATAGTLWRIDLRAVTANKVELTRPVRGACGLALAPGSGSARAPGLTVKIGPPAATRHVSLVPDLERGGATYSPAELASAASD